MEKTNKYYGIIENLVRNHKKFSGYEAIIDDIIDDVYSHSEVIISSIRNDSVITAYLEKVVSTSIITVPKKLKFQQEAAPAPVLEAVTEPAPAPVLETVADPIPAPATEIIPPKEEVKVNTELVDKMINSAPVEKRVEEVAEAPIEEIIEESADEILSQSEDDLEALLEETTDSFICENELEEAFAPVNEGQIEVETVEEILSFEETKEEEEPALEELSLVIDEKEDNAEELVEEISLESEIEPEQIILPATEEVEEVEEENLESEALVEELAIVTDEEPTLEELALVEEPVRLETEEVLEEAQEEVLSFDTIEPIEEAVELEEEVLEASEEIGLSEESVELLSEESEISDISLEAPIEMVDSLEPADELKISLEDDGLSFGDFGNLEELGKTSLVEETPAAEFKPSDYSVFSFVPQNGVDEEDINDIKKSIEELNSNKPELNIAKVFNLKYKEKRSVSDIETELEMDKDKVIEALTAIIQTVETIASTL